MGKNGSKQEVEKRGREKEEGRRKIQAWQGSGVLGYFFYWVWKHEIKMMDCETLTKTSPYHIIPAVHLLVIS